jgi:hypothetical protein
MLSMLSGKTHEVYSGLALVYNGRTVSGFDITRVKFKDISEREINLYIKTGDPMTRAGSYGAEGIGAAFIERIDGDFFNIAGLPVFRFVKMLKDRWIELRKTPLNSLDLFIDSLAQKLELSQQQNFNRWKILDKIVWPNPVINYTYAGEILHLKNWVNSRMSWIDTQLK